MTAAISGMIRTKRRREHSVKVGKGKWTFHRVNVLKIVHIILYTYLLNISELYTSSFTILLANPTHLTLLSLNPFFNELIFLSHVNDSVVVTQTPKNVLKSIQLC